MTRIFFTPARAAVTATLAATLTLAALPAHAEEFPVEPMPDTPAAVQTFDVAKYAPLPAETQPVQKETPAASAEFPDEPGPDEPVSPTAPPQVDTPTDPVAPPPPPAPDPAPTTQIVDTAPSEITPVSVLDEQPMAYASEAPQLAVTGANEVPVVLWGVLAPLAASGLVVGAHTITRTRKN